MTYKVFPGTPADPATRDCEWCGNKAATSQPHVEEALTEIRSILMEHQQGESGLPFKPANKVVCPALERIDALLSQDQQRGVGEDAKAGLRRTLDEQRGEVVVSLSREEAKRLWSLADESEGLFGRYPSEGAGRDAIDKLDAAISAAGGWERK